MGFLAFGRGLFAELLDVAVALLGVLLALGEKLLGMLRIDDRKLGEAGLLHDEVAKLGEVGLRAIEGEWALPLLL